MLRIDKSGGCVDRSPDYMKALRHAQIREYFFGHGEDALAPFDAQEAWDRAFAGPFGAVPDGVSAAWGGGRDLAAGTPALPGAFDLRWLNLALGLVLVAVLVAAAGALRRLPLAVWGALR